MATEEAWPNSQDAGVSFVNGDILDLTGLVAKLKDAEDPLSLHLREQFAEETQRLLEDFNASASDASELVAALVDDLNRIVRGGPLFDERRFAHLVVTDEARRLLRQNPRGADLVLLNVVLLESAYSGELLPNFSTEPKMPVERVQTGVRIEKRMLKVLKGLAEASDMNLGELLEDIVLHAFGGVSTFDHPRSQERIAALKSVYGMDYHVHAVRRFSEGDAH
jgi:hypothetical protein